MPYCRVCDNSIAPFMSFGKMPIANGFLKEEDFPNESFFELATCFCEQCQMFQLSEQPPANIMFHDNYSFFSKTSRRMALHFKEFAQDIINNYLPEKNSFVVELGSNDGIFLEHFATAGINHLGIEPSSNVAKVATDNGVNTVCDFFSDLLAENIKNQYQTANVITAANVMCHIPDINSVARGIAQLLDVKGFLIFEDPYLGDVIQKTSYDQIYDEHVFLFSTHSVNSVFNRHGLEIIDVKPQPTHGGSMRYILAHQGQYDISDSVTKQLMLEKNLHLDNPATYDKFRLSCEKSKHDLVNLIHQINSNNKSIAGYAATSKSTTIINYCNITANEIKYISDTTPIKQNKFSPGAHIPIKSYEYFQDNYPDFAILFAWNHAVEIFAKEQSFINQGGQWIVFVPTVQVVEKEYCV